MKFFHIILQAESLQKKLPKNCNSLFLPAVPVRMFLNNLEKANFYIYEPSLSRKNGLLPLYLYWKKIKKTF